MLSETKVIFEGQSWGENPTELSNCSSVLEIHSLEDWRSVDAFLEKNKGKHIAFLLSHQLKGLFADFEKQSHPDINFPLAVFIVFETVIEVQGNQENTTVNDAVSLASGLSKEEYLERISSIKSLIQKGEFYETNFCFEHFANKKIVPTGVYSKIRKLSNAPFLAHFQYKNHHVLSGSPELFFEKEQNLIRCAPIKGTRPRGLNGVEDAALKNELKNNVKERAENIMIVDLVRHDLSQIAIVNSVKVDSLCSVHSFETVHQLISNVSAELKPSVKFSEIVEKLFPVGSMTGAPKISAVKYTDALEPSPRITYSGALGWIKPSGDIVSSVSIRGVYYDSENQYISVSVGGAITALSEPEDEYDECLTKLKMMQSALNGDQ